MTPNFDRTKFLASLTNGTVFTPAQIDALAEALEASLGGTVPPGESHDAPPLRGAATDLS